MPVTASDTVRRSSPSSGCPPKAAIDARILFVKAYFQTHRDSDDRARVYDAYITNISGGCATAEQTQAILMLSSLLQVQSREDEAGFYEGISGLVGAAADVVTSVPEFLGTLLKLITDAETWVRVGEFIIGLILILMGLKQLASAVGVNVPTSFAGAAKAMAK